MAQIQNSDKLLRNNYVIIIGCFKKRNGLFRDDIVYELIKIEVLKKGRI